MAAYFVTLSLLEKVFLLSALTSTLALLVGTLWLVAVGCDLMKANFVRAENYQINAVDNTFHKTRFSLLEAIALLHCLDIILED